MVTLEQLYDAALALPESTTEDHQGIDSFRVAGRIFATVPDDGHVRVMVDEDEIRAAVAEDPETYEAYFFGGRLACLVVALASADLERLRELLAEAWLKKAPRSLARGFLAG